MTAQNGRLFLLRRGDGGGPETFSPLLGFRSNNLAINKEPIDTTSKDDNGWSSRLQAGLKSVTAGGSGVFKSTDTNQPAITTDMMNETLSNYELVIPGFGTFTGPFVVTQQEFGGENNDVVTFSVSVESAGPITFTAA
ncbi:MAG: phage tail tube protein [Sphingomonadales bacterium]